MKILIHVDGGLIQSVFADGEAVAADITVAIVDYDVAGTTCDVRKDPWGDDCLLWSAPLEACSHYAEGLFAMLEVP
ncbi:hypothetical protein HF282_18410 [Acidithiobacillus ferrooxidans]|nr:hypothetical protein [Acidithiobacillus ferrooxidans]